MLLLFKKCASLMPSAECRECRWLCADKKEGIISHGCDKGKFPSSKKRNCKDVPNFQKIVKKIRSGKAAAQMVMPSMSTAISVAPVASAKRLDLMEAPIAFFFSISRLIPWFTASRTLLTVTRGL